MTGTPVDLDAIKALEAAATPGPWWRDYGDVTINADDPRDVWEDEPRSARVFRQAAHRDMRDPQAIADATFVVGARADVPALVAEVERLRAELDRRADEGRRIADRIDARRRAVPKTPPDDDYAHGEAHGLYLAGRIARGWAGA